MTAITAFATNVIGTHDGMNCIVLNSGIHPCVDFSKPDEFNMDVVSEKICVQLSQPAGNYEGLPPILDEEANRHCAGIYDLWTEFGAHYALCELLCDESGAPTVHPSLRLQLLETRIKVVEIFPPAVQAELHDAKHQPHIKDETKIGMPLDQFTKETYQALAGGYEQIPIGRSKSDFQAFKTKRQVFSEAVKGVSGGKIDWKPQGTVPQRRTRKRLLHESDSRR